MSSTSSEALADTGNRATSAIAIAWVECTLAISIVFFRFWGRILIKGIGFDDWTMLFTLTIFIVWSSIVTWYAAIGGFRHVAYLVETGADIERITYVNYLIQFISTFSYAPAKTSVAALVLRIIGSRATAQAGGWRKWLIYGTISLTWVATIINCAMTYAQCDPPSALWNPEISHHCWDPEVEPHFAYFTSSVNILTDVILAFIPASIIYNLKLELKKRVSLSIMLGLGVIAGICGIVKTTYLPSLSGHADITWKTYNLIVWAGSELFILVFCGSVPPLKPLWDRYVSGKAYVTSKRYVSDPSKQSDLPNSRKISARKFDSDTLLSAAVEPAVYGLDNMPGDQRKEGIRRTTDVEVSSSHETSSV